MANGTTSDTHATFGAAVLCAFALVLAGCTTFFDTSTDPDEGSGGGVETNACGGEGALRFEGTPATVGERCGACGDGFLVCAGLTALGCVGATPENACGGCGELPAEPYTACGACGDGQWECEGADALRCAYASSANACGGCTALEGAPGFECAANPPSTWVCDGADQVACVAGLLNECGGDGELGFGDRSARPGEPCPGACQDGVLRCAGPDVLACEGAVDENECGGCAVPPGDIGAPCGPCGGVWACSENGDYVCDYSNGAGAPNACGGCSELASEPGEACAEGAVAVCIGPDAVTCVSTGPETNACGGLGSIAEDESPGTRCGACGLGFYACEGTAGTRCVDAVDDNGCGGCTRLEAAPGTRCGPCGSGSWSCEGTESVACTNAAEADAQGLTNACGGCGELYGEIGATCGICRTYECLGTSSLQCVFNAVDNCVGDVTCEELGCDALFRTCLLEADPPTCGACLDGFVEADDGVCVPNRECVGPADCPDPIERPWSACGYEAPCGEVGFQSRTLTEFDCVAGRCRPRNDEEFRSAGCPERDTDGDDVTAYFAPDVFEIEIPPEECPSLGDDCAREGGLVIDGAICQAGEPVPGDVVIGCDRGDTEGITCAGGQGVCEDGRCNRDALRGGVGDRCGRDAECDLGNCSEGICAPEGFVTIPAGRFDMGARTGSMPALCDICALCIPGEVTCDGYCLPLEDDFGVCTQLCDAMGDCPGTNTECVAFDDGGERVSVCLNEGVRPDGSGANLCPDDFQCIEAGGVGDGEFPLHEVRITRDFFALIYEFPRSIAATVLPGIDPEVCSDCPITNLSWYSAIELANALSRFDGLQECYEISDAGVAFVGVDCLGYRLPTEAEWEYMARAGTDEVVFCGDDPSCLEPYGVFNAARPELVGSARPNPFGLTDIEGNAAEWVWDAFDRTYYQRSPLEDPTGPGFFTGGVVVRGCSYLDDPSSCRHAARYVTDPNQTENHIGVRYVRTAP